MGVKQYFKKEFQCSTFSFNHDLVYDFYLSCFQRNRSVLPLLCIRGILFMGCVVILLTTMFIRTSSCSWWLFLPHWGIMFITVTCGLAYVISSAAYLGGTVCCTYLGVPWYVKVYWMCYNMTIPTTFFITVYYWAFTEWESEFSSNLVLNVLIHGVNSIIILILLVTNRHPTRILHIYVAILPIIIYLIFTYVLYYTGGIRPFDYTTIYPHPDWSDPVQASITAAMAVGMVIAMHLLAVVITVLRDALTKDCRNNSITISIIDGANENLYKLTSLDDSIVDAF